MPHVLVAGPLHGAGRALLAGQKGWTAEIVDGQAEADYAPLIAAADALVIRTQPLGAATIARAGRLRLVSRHGVGFDAVDVAALSARGIPLCICGDVNSSAVAEHAMAMILSLVKRLRQADAAVRAGDWAWRNRLVPQDLRGRRLLILGFGRIGRQTAAMAAGFGMELRAHDPSTLARGWPEGPARPVASLEEGLAWAEVISVSTPYAGRPLLGPKEFARMRRGVILVNTARGGIVDEGALVAALASGQVGAAGLDVFGEEPLPPGHPLTGFDQVLLSPHAAGVTEGAAERMAVASVQNVVDFFAGKLDPRLIVNAGALAGREGVAARRGVEPLLPG